MGGPRGLRGLGRLLMPPVSWRQAATVACADPGTRPSVVVTPCEGHRRHRGVGGTSPPAPHGRWLVRMQMEEVTGLDAYPEDVTPLVRPRWMGSERRGASRRRLDGRVE